MREAELLDYDKEGRAIINVGIKTAEDFFYSCSYKSYDLMSADVVQYVEMFESQVPKGEDITIDVYTEEKTDNFDKTRIKSSIKRHYAEKVVSLKQKQKKDLWVGSILILLGVILAWIECVTWAKFNMPFVDLLLSIVAWTFVWDGFEMLALDLPQLMQVQKKNYRIMNAKVHVRQYNKTIQREYGLLDDDD